MAKDRREYQRQYQAKWSAANKDKIRAYTAQRKEYQREYHRTWYLENREKVLARHKARYYEDWERSRALHRGYKRTADLKQYGLTIAQYEAMMLAQQERCKICGQLERKHHGTKRVRLSVDHDKNTGRVRGLLCSGCNLAIGIFDHDTGRLLQAVAYLEQGN